MPNKVTYATVSDLRDVYPNIDKYDGKQQIYAWKELFSHGGFKLYEGDNSGLVNVLFKDGEDLTPYQRVESYADSTTNTNEAVDIVETAIDVVDASVFGYGDIIKIDSEKMLITNISSNTITVERGFLGTSTATHDTATDIYLGVEWSEENQWLYNSGCDAVLFYSANSNNPNDSLMESGEDWATHKTDLLYKASRYFDSYVDASLPAQMSKNDEGEYPYLVIRTTAQICAYFLISAHDPENEDALRIKEEYEEILDKLVSGQIKLDFEKSADSSKGIIRELSASGTLRPVDLRGSYRGGVYDKIRIEIETAGVIGTAKYSVWTAGNDKLGINKGNLTIDNEVITGEYQSLSGGLQVRFGASTPTGTNGATDNLMTASATLHDVWEVEVWGVGEEVDDARGIKSAQLTRS